MKSNILVAIRFVILILAQVLIGNNMRIFGYVNPQFAILFVLWFPLSNNKIPLLLTSFFFGLVLDTFENSGGINAFSYVLIAFLYQSFLQFITRDNDLDYKIFRLVNLNASQQVIIVFLLAFIFQFSAYLLEYYDVNYIGTITYKSFINSIFTTITILLLMPIFSKKS